MSVTFFDLLACLFIMSKLLLDYFGSHYVQESHIDFVPSNYLF